jgi:type IV pilus assembly protein PilP
MKNNRAISFFAAASLMAVVAVAACGGGKTADSGLAGQPAAAPPPPVRGAAAAAAAVAAASASAGADGGSKLEFQESDFAETDRSRDPFRSYAKVFVEQSAVKVKVQRDVVLEKYAVDDLKLAGIVSGTADPRAMFIDPTGKGWVVHRGQFIGRAEVVHAKGPSSADYELNWRVDRIRDGDVIIVREDPARSDIPPVSRVIPLRTESNENRH